MTPDTRESGVHRALYHVPRSQVWEGSRGRQSGHVHLHVGTPINRGRIVRVPGQALCRKVGWYERPADGEQHCQRCSELAERFGIEWPEVDGA